MKFQILLQELSLQEWLFCFRSSCLKFVLPDSVWNSARTFTFCSSSRVLICVCFCVHRVAQTNESSRAERSTGARCAVVKERRSLEVVVSQPVGSRGRCWCPHPPQRRRDPNHRQSSGQRDRARACARGEGALAKVFLNT